MLAKKLNFRLMLPSKNALNFLEITFGVEIIIAY